MTEIHILSQKKDEGPIYKPKYTTLNLSDTDGLYFCVMEAGMVSGEPSVMIVVEPKQLVVHNTDGLPGYSVFLQTSLDKFLAAAIGMKSLAETRFGWTQPEGHFSIVPTISKEARKAILEGIKAELESFED